MNRTFFARVAFLLGALFLTTPAGADHPLARYVEMDFSGKADTLTTAFIRQFLNPSKGTFWAVPASQSNRESLSATLYWQQAHAMDVVIYSYQRIKDHKTTTARTYERYMKSWYTNHANNWYHQAGDATGFYNEFTDDMCWIGLTLMHLSEALADDQYAATAKKVYDDYIRPRGSEENGYWSLPWKSNDNGRNSCTNAPGSLLASKLYLKYGGQNYLDDAKAMCAFLFSVMHTDGSLEDPPLTYTQGTFAEACRQLYHITGESTYIQTAQKVINYLLTSTRCTYNGILRDEGSSVDQSIFKAVAIPYAVNMVLDESVALSYRRSFLRLLQKNATTLWANLNLKTYPSLFCNYYWGAPVDASAVPSMGAMASGASLMENVARMANVLLAPTETGAIAAPPLAAGTSAPSSRLYSLSGRAISANAPSGVYVKGRMKVVRK